MPKITKWSRADDVVNRFDHFEYYWDHDLNDRLHVAIRDYDDMPRVENRYHVVLIEDGDWTTLREGDKVEPLRDWATDWMGRNPQP